MDALSLIVGIVVGAAVGFLLARLLRGGDESAAVVQARHQAELAEVRAADGAARASIEAQLAGAAAQVEALQRQVADHQRQYQVLLEQHQAERAERERRAETDSAVLQALAPVSKSLAQMQETVGELERQRTRQHGELSEQLRATAASEQRIRATADALAAALKSNSTRGVWGETQLRTVVEAAGLIEQVDFSVQSSIASDSGAGRPDMIVHLPGGKSIAVDAKAPFTAFLEASSIPVAAEGADATRRDELIRAHVKAVRAHVTALGDKAYWNGLGVSPEFVIAFIPSESLVSAAMEADPSLMEFAFSRRVALASPVTLWSVLKTVAYTWQQDVLTRDAQQLFDLSKELYARLGTMADHIDRMGRSLASSVKHYNGFVGSLERSVLPSARRLNALDESAIPALTGIDTAPRPMTAPELASGAATGPDEG